MHQYNSVFNINNRLLDLVICNGHCNVEKSIELLVSEDIHHPALIVSLDAQFVNPNVKFPIKTSNSFNFRKANFFVLYDQLLHIDWTFLSECDDVTICVDLFYNKLTQIFYENIPKFKTPKNKRQFPPWFNGEIIKNIKLKHKKLVSFRRHGNNETLSEFRRLRSQVKSDIKIAFQNYANRIENNITSEPNKFWSYINGKKGKTSIPKDMFYNNEPLGSPNDIVDAFANFFERSYCFNISDDPEVKSNNLSFDCLDIKRFSEAEVCTALKRIKPKLTAGPDGIPAFLLRDCASIFAYPLCIIFNLCLKNCSFPDIWKYSKVCPVYKKGEKNEITNYRPITIICNFGKVFEILLHDNIYSHVQQKISTQQHGFMKLKFGGRTNDPNE